METAGRRPRDPLPWLLVLPPGAGESPSRSAGDAALLNRIIFQPVTTASVEPGQRESARAIAQAFVAYRARSRGVAVGRVGRHRQNKQRAFWGSARIRSPRVCPALVGVSRSPGR